MPSLGLRVTVGLVFTPSSSMEQFHCKTCARGEAH
jgi:hypothetical protein